VNQADLVSSVSNRCGVPEDQTEKVLRALSMVVVEEVARGGAVTIRQLGRFHPKRTEARRMYIPAKGRFELAGGFVKPVFKPSKTFKKFVREQAERYGY
jgi:nucleoid DNA-binding protein